MTTVSATFALEQAPLAGLTASEQHGFTLAREGFAPEPMGPLALAAFMRLECGIEVDAEGAQALLQAGRLQAMRQDAYAKWLAFDTYLGRALAQVEQRCLIDPVRLARVRQMV